LGHIQKKMRKLLTIIFLIFSFCSFSQTIEDFKNDFEKSIDKDFSEEQLNQMFRTYSNLLTPHSDITQLTAGIKGESIQEYPLNQFKNDKLYKKNINKLFDSDNSYQRILAYLVIAGSGDKSFEEGLLKKIEKETNKGNLIWSGMALLYLNTEHTTLLFDFLVKNESFGDAHMLPLYFKLNSDSLQSTAYQRIQSENIKAKILAAQILSATGKNEKTEKLLLEAVKTWDYNIKGYAIYSVKVLKIGNLLESFQPLLDSTQTRPIAIEALANSPTKEDVEYLKKLAIKQDTVSEDLLDGLYKSTNPENIKYWLEILRTKPVPPDYYFNNNKQPLLYSAEILTDLQLTLVECQNSEIIQNLVKGLKGRVDEKSITILLKLLSHSDSSVRYWTASALKGNNSLLIVNEIIKLIKSPLYRTVAFTDILINNGIDTLQPTFVSIYANNPNRDWKRSSIEYLSTFPLDKHMDIFKAILNDKEEDTFIKRNAALGLGRLKGASSVDLIISACKEESEASDYNAQIFLRALEMIKGDKAKDYITSFKNSKEQNVRQLVNEILNNW
jgi:HEAT repeat protein